jgi:hypothetical protein
LTYHLIYKIEPRPEGLEAAEVPEGFGACSAVILHSIIRSQSGGLSLCTVSGDGKTGLPLDDDEYFKIWAMHAHDLAQSTTLGEGRRALCQAVHEAVRAAILSNRAKRKQDEAEGKSS